MLLFNQHIIFNNFSGNLGDATPSKQEAISSPAYGKSVGFEKYLF